MIKNIIFDLSYTLLFPQDKFYKKELNQLHRSLSKSGNYDFSRYFKLDLETMDFVKSLKKKYRLFMYTSGNIQNVDEIRHELTTVFEEIVSASEIGYSKKDHKGYVFLAEYLKIKPEESVFVDDLNENSLAAHKAGYKTILFRGLKDLRVKIHSILD